MFDICLKDVWKDFVKDISVIFKHLKDILKVVFKIFIINILKVSKWLILKVSFKTFLMSLKYL